MPRLDKISIVETIIMDKANTNRTADGYLATTAKVARRGIQIYKGFELGIPEVEDVRVYRPEEEVFNPNSLKTFAYRPLTDDHPEEPVTAKNWKQFAVGQSGGDVLRDGDFISVPLVLMDAAVIDKVDQGKAELSVGYSAVLKWGDGVTPQGEKYDAIQTDIRANHIAIVKNARGGAELKIGDEKLVTDNNGEDKMTTKTIIVDGINVAIPEMEANIVQRHIQTLQESAAKLKTDLEAANVTIAKTQTDSAVATTESKKAIEAKDAEIVTLKKQLEDAKLTPAGLDKLVKDRSIVIAKARVKLGDALVIDNQSLGEIFAQVVRKELGEAAKDWTEEQIKASFDTLTAGIDLSKQNGADFLANILSNTVVTDASKKVEASYTEYDKKLQERWRTPTAA